MYEEGAADLRCAALRSVEGSGVDVSVGLEITLLLAVLVVVQQTEALITVQTRIRRSESVVRRYPPEETVTHAEKRLQVTWEMDYSQ